jgi:predicted phosphohydrolase
MKVFAISDLHLSLSAAFVKGAHNPLSKPMDIFGQIWGDYHEKIYDNWQSLVGHDDFVLMPGDTSWGMTLEDCRHDFDFLAQLPGTIILGRGNHDYWWQGPSKLKKYLPANIIPLHHDCYVVGSKAVCSTRAWSLSALEEGNALDKRVYERELLRLQMALDNGQKTGLPLVAMLHYMPFYQDGRSSAFVDMLHEYGVQTCVYGHLHGANCQKAVQGLIDDIEYINVSCDCLGFVPRLLWEE